MRQLVIVIALALLSASCAGGFATKAECSKTCTGKRESCKRFGKEWECVLAADEIAGSNGGDE